MEEKKSLDLPSEVIEDVKTEVTEDVKTETETEVVEDVKTETEVIEDVKTETEVVEDVKTEVTEDDKTEAIEVDDNAEAVDKTGIVHSDTVNIDVQMSDEERQSLDETLQETKIIENIEEKKKPEDNQDDDDADFEFFNGI